LAGARYYPVFGADVSGAEALLSEDMRAILECVIAEIKGTDPTGHPIELVVDGFEDTTQLKPGVLRLWGAAGVSRPVVDGTERLFRMTLAEMRSRAVVEFLRSRLPGTMIRSGLSHVEEAQGNRGVVVYAREPSVVGVGSQDTTVNVFCPERGLSRDTSTGAAAPTIFGGSGADGSIWLGFNGGYSWLHRSEWTVLGAVAGVDPGWGSGLSVDTAFNVHLGQEAVYISATEAETRVTRDIAVLRWEFLPAVVEDKVPGRHVAPFLSAGGAYEPAIGLGAVFGLGISRSVDWLALDLLAQLTYFGVDKHGRTGVEILLRPRILGPLHPRLNRTGKP
jgi:hypothetical protein